jgi:hypothetical protein
LTATLKRLFNEVIHVQIKSSGSGSRGHYLYPAVFFAIAFGWATNCLPAALPARLALVVAAYSLEDKDLMAASGKYLSPVLLDGLPDLVRHFWSPQSLRDF